jgi:hypothetical protein
MAVKDVKIRLQKLIGVSSECILLIYSGREIDDDDTLENFVGGIFFFKNDYFY